MAITFLGEERIKEYDTSAQVYEEDGRKGVKDAAGQIVIPVFVQKGDVGSSRHRLLINTPNNRGS